MGTGNECIIHKTAPKNCFFDTDSVVPINTKDTILYYFSPDYNRFVLIGAIFSKGYPERSRRMGFLTGIRVFDKMERNLRACLATVTAG
jgi:hypothetical protein